MAEVFRAKITSSHGFEKVLVVKRILPHLAADQSFVSMFIDEAKLTAQLTHPKIVQILDFGEVNGQYFTALEFVRRLLLHVLPTGFMRIRHYGILANRHRHAKLALCRQLLGSGTAAEPESPEETRETRECPSSITPTRVCPVCGAGRMIVIEEFPPLPAGQEAHEGAGLCVGFDSS